jgi:hypothetical protein
MNHVEALPAFEVKEEKSEESPESRPQKDEEQ